MHSLQTLEDISSKYAMSLADNRLLQEELNSVKERLNQAETRRKEVIKMAFRTKLADHLEIRVSLFDRMQNLKAKKR